MAITKEQAEQIKKQLLEQVEKNVPENQKEATRKQIQEMNEEQIEEFLKQNNSGQQKCIFCSIAKNETKSYKIGENEKAIAILELNPISPGHTLIIPKDHIPNSGNPPQEVQNLTKEIIELLKEKLGPKDVILGANEMFGHGIVNLVPVYNNETLESPKKQASESELKEIQEKIFARKEEPIKDASEEEKEVITEKDTWLPKRVP